MEKIGFEKFEKIIIENTKAIKLIAKKLNAVLR
jgi:hypothetical protein